MHGDKDEDEDGDAEGAEDERELKMRGQVGDSISRRPKKVSDS